MTVVVSFGLLIATFLTLVVVLMPYFLLERTKEGLVAGLNGIEGKVAVYRMLGWGND